VKNKRTVKLEKNFDLQASGSVGRRDQFLSNNKAGAIVNSSG
jgi:hypothetical protein